MTKIGIKYNTKYQHSGHSMASKPGPIMKPDPAFLKEIKTNLTLVDELLATITKRNKAMTQIRTTCIWFGTVEPDEHSEYSISSIP